MSARRVSPPCCRTRTRPCITAITREDRAAFHEKACAKSLEGIVSKRANAPYAPGNRGLWLKVKCLHREEFVVVGWTDPGGARSWFGALLATSEMPLEVPPPRTSRFGSPLVVSRVRLGAARLVAEVKYLTWTDDNLLRQVVYEGLREDKPAEVRLPVPVAHRFSPLGTNDQPGRLSVDAV